LQEGGQKDTPCTAELRAALGAERSEDGASGWAPGLQVRPTSRDVLVGVEGEGGGRTELIPAYKGMPRISRVSVVHPGSWGESIAVRSVAAQPCLEEELNM